MRFGTAEAAGAVELGSEVTEVTKWSQPKEGGLGEDLSSPWTGNLAFLGPPGLGTRYNEHGVSKSMSQRCKSSEAYGLIPGERIKTISRKQKIGPLL